MVASLDLELAEMTDLFRSLTMSNDIDLSGLEAAYVADLGRQCQDQLSLSNIERRGPSFAPNGRNGTSHYALKLKDHLESIWSVQIQDEEAAQIEGLSNGDARPWAKKSAPACVASTIITSATTKASWISQGTKARTLDINFSSREPVGRLGGLLPPGGKTVMVASSRNPNASAIETLPKILEPPPTELDPWPAGSQSKAASIPDYVLCQGECEVKAAKSQVIHKATFAMKIRTSTNYGYITLSAPGMGDHIYDVLELESPVMKDGYCHITTSRDASKETSKAGYGVRLPGQDQTEKFKLYLDNLRCAAMRQLSPSATMPVAAVEQISASAEASTTLAQPNLIDLTDPVSTVNSPVKKGDVSRMTIEDATEHLHSLIQRIVPEITGHGLRMDDATIDDLEEAAIDFWLNRGFLGSDKKDMKAELLELLRLLARIRLKSELRRGTQVQPQPQLPSADLKELVIEKLASPRIQYTPAQIQNLRNPKPLSKADQIAVKPPTFQLFAKRVAEITNNLKKNTSQSSKIPLSSAKDLAASSIATWQTEAATPTASHDALVAPTVAYHMPFITPFRLAREAAARDAIARARKEVKLIPTGVETQRKRHAALAASDSSLFRASKLAFNGLSSSRWAK